MLYKWSTLWSMFQPIVSHSSDITTRIYVGCPQMLTRTVTVSVRTMCRLPDGDKKTLPGRLPQHRWLRHANVALFVPQLGRWTVHFVRWYRNTATIGIATRHRDPSRRVQCSLLCSVGDCAALYCWAMWLLDCSLLHLSFSLGLCMSSWYFKYKLRILSNWKYIWIHLKSLWSESATHLKAHWREENSRHNFTKISSKQLTSISNVSYVTN